MPEPRLLRHAPIREAVVGIQVPVPKEPVLDVLEELANGLEHYPVVHKGYEFSGNLSVDSGGSLVEEPLTTPSGFRAISEDETQIVQFRNDGFSFSRLAPYETWEAVREEAEGLWQLYRARLDPSYATKLTVRYVNHIRLPNPLPEIGDYFLGMPALPDEWPQVVSSFVYRQTLHDQPKGHSANVMHALVDDVDEERLGVIFDIDAYAQGPLALSEESLWGTLEQLRNLKNRIFFSGITTQALELFD